MCKGYIQRWYRFQLIATMILINKQLKEKKKTPDKQLKNKNTKILANETKDENPIQQLW